MAGSRSVRVRAVFAQAQMSIPGSFAVSPSGAANYTISIQVLPLLRNTNQLIDLKWAI